MTLEQWRDALWLVGLWGLLAWLGTLQSRTRRLGGLPWPVWAAAWVLIAAAFYSMGNVAWMFSLVNAAVAGGLAWMLRRRARR